MKEEAQHVRYPQFKYTSTNIAHNLRYVLELGWEEVSVHFHQHLYVCLYAFDIY